MNPFIVVIALSVPTLAAAEGSTSSPAPVRARTSIAAAAILALPQADADDAVDASAGVGVSAAFWAHPNVAVVGAFDYVFGNAKDADVDVAFYAFDIGARFAPLERSGLRPFGELAIGRHSVRFAASGVEDSESDLGFRLGGGVTYRVGPRLAIVGRLRFSSAEIEDVDIDAFLFDIGIVGEP